MKFETELDCVKYWINKDLEYIAKKAENPDQPQYETTFNSGRKFELDSIMEVIKSIEEQR